MVNEILILTVASKDEAIPIPNGRACTFYLNGDAMGKSMQGAGGVLVLGSVLDSIVVRMKHSRELNGQSPDAWLQNTFLELHQVFESFDGSMLISVVMGIVVDDTGLMYALNAEHPASVLIF